MNYQASTMALKDGKKYFCVVICQNTLAEYGMADLVKNRLRDLYMSSETEDSDVLCDYYENSVDGICMVWYYADTRKGSTYTDKTFAEAEIHGFIYDANQYVNPMVKPEDRVSVKVFKHTDPQDLINQVLSNIKNDRVFQKDLQAAKYIENITLNINQFMNENKNVQNVQPIKSEEEKNDELVMRKESILFELDRYRLAIKKLESELEEINRLLYRDETPQEISNDEDNVNNIPAEEIKPKEEDEVVRPKTIVRDPETVDNNLDISAKLLNKLDELPVFNGTHTTSYREPIISNPLNNSVGTESITTETQKGEGANKMNNVVETTPEDKKEPEVQSTTVTTPVVNINIEIETESKDNESKKDELIKEDKVKEEPKEDIKVTIPEEVVTPTPKKEVNIVKEFKEESTKEEVKEVTAKSEVKEEQTPVNNQTDTYYTVDNARADIRKVIESDEDFDDWDSDESELFLLFLQNLGTLKNTLDKDAFDKVKTYATTKYLGDERDGENLPEGITTIRELKVAEYF